MPKIFTFDTKWNPVSIEIPSYDEMIENARQEWRAEMKAQCLAVIPERNDVNKFSYDIDTAYNLGIKHCRQNISSL